MAPHLCFPLSRGAESRANCLLLYFVDHAGHVTFSPCDQFVVELLEVRRPVVRPFEVKHSLREEIAVFDEPNLDDDFVFFHLLCGTAPRVGFS